MTPYEKPNPSPMRPGLSFAILDEVAYRISDNAAADALQQARRKLFTTIMNRNRNGLEIDSELPSLQAHFRIGKYCYKRRPFQCYQT